jgi:hypothetical protein
MNIEAEKLKLIEWLVSLRDETTIEKLKFLHENLSEATDWWDTISEAEKESIDRGIKDIENGKTIPHSEVKKKYDKYL